MTDASHRHHKHARPALAPHDSVGQCMRAWREIDDYAFQHVHPDKDGGMAVLKSAEAASEEAGMPPGHVSPMFGKFLALQARLVNAKHVLEVGTLGGYSAIWMAQEVSDVHITTLERSAKHAEVARTNIAHAGVAERVTVLEGAALDVLPTLLAEVQSGSKPSFDMAFIDADKLNSLAYSQYAAKLCRKGACVIVDNIMGRGSNRVDDPSTTEEHALGGKQVIEGIAKEQKLDGVILQFVGVRGYDGFYMGIVT